MKRVARRLRLWGGHLFLVPVAIAALTTLMYAREALRADMAEVAWLYFLLAVGAFLSLVVFGILATALFNTYKERYYLRALWASEDAKAAGAYRSTQKRNEAGSEAYSPDGEDSYA